MFLVRLLLLVLSSFFQLNSHYIVHIPRNIALVEKISSLFEEFLSSGKQDFLSQIENIVNDMKLKNFAEKKDFLIKVLKKLQDNADMQMKKLDKKVKKDLDKINSRNILDDKEYAEQMRNLGKRHTRENEFVNQRSQEIITKLQPLCSDSQRILFNIDRKGNNQLIDLVDMKKLSPTDFFIDSDKKLNDDEKIRLLNKIAKENDGLQIPEHRWSQPLFFDQLKKEVLEYHSSLHAQHKFNILQLGDHEGYESLTKNSLEKFGRNNKEFGNLVREKLQRLYIAEHMKTKQQADKFDIRMEEAAPHLAL
ncbi:hypothetical protein HYV11_00970 [Candidatus Dependentiae bacterium]|nr:hypothetical protein [Candidatus Dependentiae bacterium]